VILDAEIRHGYSFKDIHKLAGYAAHRSYWQRVISAQDRYNLALSGIAEFLVVTDDPPGQKDLVMAGIQAINRDVAAQLRQEGINHRKPIDGDGPNMAHFCTYWWSYIGHVGSHENSIVEVVAMFQILPQLRPANRDTILALATHGTYDKAAAALGIQHRHTFESRLSRARLEFLRLWHQGEQPTHVWGQDRHFGEEHKYKESITVRTLRARKRMRKQKNTGPGPPVPS
jgi:hypothetical protein